MILAAGLSPAWQQIVLLDELHVGEVNRARQVHWCASGKVLNVGIALHCLCTAFSNKVGNSMPTTSLGMAPSKTLSILGGPHGEAIEREFADLGVPRRWVLTTAPTRVCTTVLDRSSGTTTELVENAGAITADELEAFRQAYAEIAARTEIVVLTGSLPAGSPATLYRELLEQTPGRAILDIRGPELLAALECRPLLVKPNREELVRTVGRAINSDDDVRAAIRELHDRGAEWVLITHGRQPAWLSGTVGDFFRITPPAVETVNPIGCGDCLAAGVAWAVSAGQPMPQAVRYGMAAASMNARHLLPARLDPDRVFELLESVELADSR